jgi:hypothetical protein
MAFFPFAIQAYIVATLTWPSVGVKPNTWKSWGFGVLRDSRMFRARPLPEVWIGSAIRRWKDLDRGYNFCLDLVAIRACSRELWAPKVPRLHPGLHPGQFRDNFGTPTWESREFVPFGCSPHGALQSIL